MIDGTTERQVAVDRYGHEIHPTLDSSLGERNLVGVVGRVEAITARRFDTLGRYQVVEIPGKRRIEWIARGTTYAVNAFEVLAYVGDATGQEAVDLSERFLAQLEEAYAPPAEEVSALEVAAQALDWQARECERAARDLSDLGHHGQAAKASIQSATFESAARIVRESAR